MKRKIFIACDTIKISQINKILKNTRTDKLNVFYKFGLEFFNSKLGRTFLSKTKEKNKIWLDIKLFDIPNTVSSSINSLKDLKNLNYLTIHVSGGLEMMLAAKKAAKKTNKNLKILGVTILTSFSEKSLRDILYYRKIKNSADIILWDSSGLEQSKEWNYEWIKSIPNNFTKMIAGNITLDKLEHISTLADIVDVSGALETNNVKDINKIKKFLNKIKIINDKN
jgi:phosphoribosylanthranilate isomerase